MTNPLTEFTRKNISELILGLAVGVILALLMDLTFVESVAIIVLAPLVAIIFNQLLQVFVPNERNQRTALVIIGIIGGFFLVQQFGVGVFSFENANVQSFAEVQAQPQISGALLAGIGSIVGGVAKLPLLIILIIVIGALLVFYPPIGIVVLALLIIPVIFLGFQIFQNFTLILILVAMYAVASLMFKSKVRQKALAQS